MFGPRASPGTRRAALAAATGGGAIRTGHGALGVGPSPSAWMS